MKAVEYRYLVRGLKKDWSSWSTTNNVVNFSYLPTGSYKLEIQTRDLMGKVSDVEKIDLEVDPPYWKESWFYAAEFIFFTVLVFVSRGLSGSNSRYRFISRVLSLLTVIMLIQFIQTVVASQISFKSTPVIEFFIQVSIALLVLPLEGYLRKTIVKRSA
jgi:Y_Y_Y domain